MPVVYILQNSISKRHYIGCTNDLSARLKQHNRGHTKATRVKGEWTMVYTEVFNNLSTARKREQQIKSYKGGEAFKRLFDHESTRQSGGKVHGFSSE